MKVQSSLTHTKQALKKSLLDTNTLLLTPNVCWIIQTFCEKMWEILNVKSGFRKKKENCAGEEKSSWAMKVGTSAAFEGELLSAGSVKLLA